MGDLKDSSILTRDAFEKIMLKEYKGSSAHPLLQFLVTACSSKYDSYDFCDELTQRRLDQDCIPGGVNKHTVWDLPAMCRVWTTAGLGLTNLGGGSLFAMIWCPKSR